MRNVTIRVMIALAAVFLLIPGCGGKYDDAIAVNDQFVEAVETYCSEMEKAEGTDDIAGALNNFAAEVEKLAPKMKAVAEKYPELNAPDQIPDELKESQARAAEVGMKMAGHMMKAAANMRDAGVKEAQIRMQKALASMGK